VGDEAVRVWRLIHIPLCLLLAVLTGVHIWTVLYY
jgi:membrane protein YdbS with pleckstrin-like domain